PNTYGLPVIEFLAGEKMEYAPMNVGVILSGGQAPGGHNVISGLFDGVKSLNSQNKLYGFLMGPGGLVDHKYVELTSNIIDEYRNTGGFDIIGSGRTKLEEESQFESGIKILRELGIKALVIIGGDDSNTNACVLAEYYAAKQYGVQVIGCPKTIDGDLKNEQIETSFGFDTACKTYSELIGNIQRDCNSSRKYWHFIKLMGRSASHIALECALQCQPNICLISEEVEAKNMSLDDIVTYIANAVAERAKDGNNFGTVLIPEGLIEFIPAIKRLISELNDVLATDEAKSVARDAQVDYVKSHISPENLAILNSLPEDVALQLALDRDPHGNVQVSLIETEKLLSRMVAAKLDEWKNEGKFVGKFTAQHHFFGYEGRCAAPSNYDADYCYSLGFNASRLIANGKTGYMSIIRNTTAPAAEWIAGGVPITMMMNMEKRSGKMKPVIRKALVELDGAPFKFFAKNRDEWAKNTCYVYPGPIQYFGPSEVCDQSTKTLILEQA
ncbi:MAG: diphosphate--fructose-6-phosphate 1-phosphotransferase, partial [Prevotellaceae bacterium]|nr:diphosphate--fructose-6-phosphate 1-phosphotransferase [Candidatus Colivivens equi]